jgi:DNA-binding transcriptional ArsR family regulator
MPTENTCIRIFADQAQIISCKNKIAEHEASFNALSNILALAGNSVRLKILYLLSEETELCPCDLSDILAMTVPAVSQHLRKMRDADIVQTRKDGQTIFYALKEDHLSIIEPLFHHIDHSKDALV